MKKFFTLIMANSVLLAAFAQITITETEMAQIGDQITRYQDTIISFGPGPAGPNQAWDFSGYNLVQRVTNTTSVVAPSSTPYASDFTGSNVAMTNDNTAYIYFSQNSSTSYTDGAAGDLLMDGNIITTIFSPALKLHNFPKTYGSNFCDDYAFDVIADGSSFSPLVTDVRLKHEATSCDTVDGWGTITTPVGTYNCIRVKKVEYALDSIWVLPLIGFPPAWTLFSDTRDTNTSYSWLTLETKLAVAEFSYDSLDQPRQLTWSAIPPTITTSITDKDASQISVYPNPSAGELYFKGLNTELVTEIRVFDSVGKLLVSKRVSNTQSIDVSALPNGIYYYELAVEGKKLKANKLLIQH